MATEIYAECYFMYKYEDNEERSNHMDIQAFDRQCSATRENESERVQAVQQVLVGQASHIDLPLLVPL